RFPLLRQDPRPRPPGPGRGRRTGRQDRGHRARRQQRQRGEGALPMTISVLPYRDELKVRDGRLFIDGQWSESSDGGTWTHVHPATNEEVARFSTAGAADVDRAVHAARRAFDEGPWP